MSVTCEIAERLAGLRRDLNISAEEMADAAGITVPKYLDYEVGKIDFGVTELFKWSLKLGVDVTELITGSGPKLSSYSIVRAGRGLAVKRRSGFSYEHLASTFKHRLMEPYKVTAPYIAASENADIELSRHSGQEMDIVLSGTLKFSINGNIEILNAGDTIYYDSSNPHGMIAIGGADAVFLAIVINN